MGSFLKKVAGVIKIVLPFAIEHWKAVTAVFSGITITGILKGLGCFINALSGFTKITVNFNFYLWVIIAISPYLIYTAIIVPISKLINCFRKPAYLTFTSMEYTDIKNNLYKLKWNYKLDNKKYIIGNIYPVCPNCGCGLAYAKDSSRIYCPVCRDGEYERFDDDDAVTKIIRHKINNKLF